MKQQEMICLKGQWAVTGGGGGGGGAMNPHLSREELESGAAAGGVWLAGWLHAIARNKRTVGQQRG